MAKQVLFLGMFVSLIWTGTLFLSADNAPEKSFNPIDLRLAQYSDRQITENAKALDPSFGQVAFLEVPAAEASPTDQLASVVKAFKFYFGERTANSQNEYGTWLWTPTLAMSEEYMRTIISEAKEEGVNTIYLSIDSYLDIYVLPQGEEKEEKEKLFSETLDKFIALAGEEGIAVDAEAGWRNWAEQGHTYKPFAVASFVEDFNEKHQNKFRGFQYDIEPYLLESYQTDKETVLKNFTKLVDQTTHYLSGSGLRFSVVLPDFFDRRDGATPKFEYRGRRDYVLGHVLGILDKNPGSSVVLMSYRNFAVGRDGSIDVSKNEFRTALWGGYETDIILAQETGDVPPPYVTFHGTSKDYFKQESVKLRSAFSSHPNFGGLSVHYANAFLELK